MKKIIEKTCGMGCLLSLVIAGGECADGSCNLGWTLGWLAAAALLGWAYGKLSEKCYEK